tara:strand:+ start:2768 stop:4783 length:2016 start_codon:yes stop_codon:yes gene_type:complete
MVKKHLKKGGNWAGPFPRIEDGDSYSKDIETSLLRGKDLGSIKFNNMNIVTCVLEDSTFTNVTFKKVQFIESNFLNVSFYSCEYNLAEFRDCNMINVTINSYRPYGQDFKTPITFINTLLHDCNFPKEYFNDFMFVGCELKDTDFSSASLEYTTFEDCDFTGVIMNNETKVEGIRIINPTNLNLSRIPQTVMDKIYSQNPDITSDVSPSYNPDDDNDSEFSMIEHDDEEHNIDDNAINGQEHNIDENAINFLLDRTEEEIQQPLRIEDLNTTDNSVDNEIDNTQEEPSELDLLLKRKKIKLEEYKGDVSSIFKKDGDKIIHSDVITMEDIDLCNYINESDNNLIFIDNNNITLIEKSTLNGMINNKDTLDRSKIVFQCKKIDGAFVAKKENIVGGPQLNLDIIAIFGVMVPLEYLDFVIKNKYNIYITTQCKNNTPVPITSLDMRLYKGESVRGSTVTHELARMINDYVKKIKEVVSLIDKETQLKRIDDYISKLRNDFIHVLLKYDETFKTLTKDIPINPATALDKSIKYNSTINDKLSREAITLQSKALLPLDGRNKEATKIKNRRKLANDILNVVYEYAQLAKSMKANLVGEEAAVSANHCQAAVAIKSCGLNYISNDVLLTKCKNGGKGKRLTRKYSKGKNSTRKNGKRNKLTRKAGNRKRTTKKHK